VPTVFDRRIAWAAAMGNIRGRGRESIHRRRVRRISVPERGERAAPADRAPVDQRLLGRSAELTRLAAGTAAAKAGSAQVVVLRGARGSGKSALLRHVGDRETTVLRADPGEGSQGVAFGVVRNLLGLGDDELADHRAATFLPAARRRVLALLTEAPLVLVVDNMQWCDEMSLRWFEFLLRRADESRLLVVFALRADEESPLDRRLAGLVPAARFRLVEPSGLGVAEVARMAEREFGRRPAPAFAHACTEFSSGNPEFATRLLERLRAGGATPDEDGIARAGAVSLEMGQAWVRDRLESEPGHVRDVIRAVAVIGPDDVELVAMLVRVPADAVAEVFESLERAPGLGREVLAGMLDELPAEELAGLRLRAARLLNDSGRPAGLVADQLLLLDRLEEPWMRETLHEAAMRAPEAGGAARYLRRLVATDPDDVGARMELAKALVEINPLEISGLLSEVLPRVTDVRERAGIAARLGAIELIMPGARMPIRLLRDALAALDGLGPEEPRTAADADLRLQLESLMLFSPRSASVHAREPEHGDTPGERQALAVRALLAMLGGTSAAKAADFAKGALRDEQAKSSWTATTASIVLFLADEFDEARRGIEAAITESEQRGAVWPHALALSAKAWILVSAGKITEAAVCTNAAMAIAAGQPWDSSAIMTRVMHALVLFNQGDVEGATSLLDRIDPWEKASAGPFDGYYYLITRAKISRFEHDFEASLGYAERCGALLDAAGVRNPVFAPSWLQAVELLMAVGRPSEAVALAERGEDMAERWGTKRALGLALMARGLTNSGRRGVDALAEAAELLSGTQAMADHTKAETLLGMALLRVDDPAGAREHLRRAVDLSVRHGGWAAATTARNMLVAAGGRMQQVSGDRVGVLTARERKVAAIAARGLSNTDIAETLSVTLRTVEVHLTSVYRKLGVASRGDLSTVFDAIGTGD
jgi:DNA-binding NarL/FixJ family response regulator